MSFLPTTSRPGCPPAYGRCSCMCHKWPGTRHCVPCCGPGVSGSLPSIVDADPGDECNELVNAILGTPPKPKRLTDSEIIERCRGAAGDVEQILTETEDGGDSCPCDEYRDPIKKAADLLRGVAQDIEDVQSGV